MRSVCASASSPLPQCRLDLMYRLSLLVLAGCHVFIDLDPHPPDARVASSESTTNDEDKDGLVDALDPCPHFGAQLGGDADKDGIGDECDPRPTDADDRHFFAFVEADARIATFGAVTLDKDVLVLGSRNTPRSSLVLDVDADTVDVLFDGAITEFDPTPAQGYCELGVYAVHRAFDEAKLLRGDNCLYGRDTNTPPNYLERNEDDIDLETRRFGVAVENAPLRFQLARSPLMLACSITIDDTTQVTPMLQRPAPRVVEGRKKIALTADNLQLRMQWLWIVTRRP